MRKSPRDPEGQFRNFTDCGIKHSTVISCLDCRVTLSVTLVSSAAIRKTTLHGDVQPKWYTCL